MRLRNCVFYDASHYTGDLTIEYKSKDVVYLFAFITNKCILHRIFSTADYELKDRH